MYLQRDMAIFMYYTFRFLFASLSRQQELPAEAAKQPVRGIPGHGCHGEEHPEGHSVPCPFAVFHLPEAGLQFLVPAFLVDV